MLSLYTTVVLAAAAWALPTTQPRQMSAVMTNLVAIDTATDALTTSITGWDGSRLGVLGVQAAVVSLSTAITTAAADAKNVAQATPADSAVALAYVTDSLGPSISEALNALTSREAAFAALGVNSLVVTNLQTLQTGTNALGLALVAISSPSVQTAAQDAISSLDAAFSSAIAAFS